MDHAALLVVVPFPFLSSCRSGGLSLDGFVSLTVVSSSPCLCIPNIIHVMETSLRLSAGRLLHGLLCLV